MHLTRRLTAEAGEHTVADVAFLWLNRSCGSTRCATAGATSRFVLQALGCVELLLAGCENKAAAAVLTNDFFIRECQLLCNLLGWGQTLRILRIGMFLRQVSAEEHADPRVSK